MAKVTIIIPSINGRHLLEESLPAIFAQSYRDFIVCVIDNGSNDGSVQWLKETYPQVSIIENDENMGFAAAVNQGIRAAESPYVCTLNNDVVVDTGWTGHLVAVADEDDAIGMCASKLMFYQEPNMINSSGICVDRAGIVWDREGGNRTATGGDSSLNLMGPCAGAALYRTKMLDEIGLFDEAYFAYFEDVDLAWRARAAGWRCEYVDAAIGYHHHSSTSGRSSRFKNFQLGKNKVRLILKNYPFAEFWWYIPMLLVYDFIAVGYQLIVHKTLQTLKGRLVGWSCMKDALAARPHYNKRYDLPYINKMTWPWSVRKHFRYLSELQH
jgi:GT2 family glycosyltransferase